MRRAYQFIVPALIVVALGLLWLAWNPRSGTTSRSVAASPPPTQTARIETKIVPLPVEVEVVKVATATIPAFQLTATVEALTPQPTRPATRTPRPTATSTPPHMTGDTSGVMGE